MGISFIVFSMKSKGVTVRPIQTIDGATRSRVFFDDVEVPVENLIGEENKGWTMPNSCSATSVPASPASACQGAHPPHQGTGLEGRIGRQARDRGPEIPREAGEVEIELKALELTQTRVVADEGNTARAANPASSVPQDQRAPGKSSRPPPVADGSDRPVRRPTTSTGRTAPTKHGLDRPDARAISTPKVSIYGGSTRIQRNIITKAVLGL